jgi:hypothetical protein
MTGSETAPTMKVSWMRTTGQPIRLALDAIHISGILLRSSCFRMRQSTDDFGILPPEIQLHSESGSHAIDIVEAPVPSLHTSAAILKRRLKSFGQIGGLADSTEPFFPPDARIRLSPNSRMNASDTLKAVHGIQSSRAYEWALKRHSLLLLSACR